MNANEADNPRPTRRRWMRFSLAAMLFAVLCWAGMLAGTRFGAGRPRLSPDPLQITIIQRQSQQVPGLEGRAAVRIDDVTRGQVLLTIEDEAGQPLAGPISVRAGDVVPFTVGLRTFYLHVGKLANELLGDDYGVFDISTKNVWAPAGAPPPSSP